MTDLMMGGVDNGARGELVSAFYTGPVGIRQRGDTLDLAWFGSVPRDIELPSNGTLDGKAISVTILSPSRLNPPSGKRIMPGSATQRTMVAATAVLAP